MDTRFSKLEMLIQHITRINPWQELVVKHTFGGILSKLVVIQICTLIGGLFTANIFILKTPNINNGHIIDGLETTFCISE